MFMPNPDPNGPMITTIGNGQRRVLVDKPTMADKLSFHCKCFSSGTTARRDGGGLSSIAGEDTCLLTLYQPMTHINYAS